MPSPRELIELKDIAQQSFDGEIPEGTLNRALGLLNSVSVSRWEEQEASTALYIFRCLFDRASLDAIALDYFTAYIKCATLVGDKVSDPLVVAFEADTLLSSDMLSPAKALPNLCAPESAEFLKYAFRSFLDVAAACPRQAAGCLNAVTSGLEAGWHALEDTADSEPAFQDAVDTLDEIGQTAIRQCSAIFASNSGDPDVRKSCAEFLASYFGVLGFAAQRAYGDGEALLEWIPSTMEAWGEQFPYDTAIALAQIRIVHLMCDRGQDQFGQYYWAQLAGQICKVVQSRFAAPSEVKRHGVYVLGVELARAHFIVFSLLVLYLRESATRAQAMAEIDDVLRSATHLLTERMAGRVAEEENTTLLVQDRVRVADEILAAVRARSSFEVSQEAEWKHIDDLLELLKILHQYSVEPLTVRWAAALAAATEVASKSGALERAGNYLQGLHTLVERGNHAPALVKLEAHAEAAIGRKC